MGGHWRFAGEHCTLLKLSTPHLTPQKPINTLHPATFPYRHVSLLFHVNPFHSKESNWTMIDLSGLTSTLARSSGNWHALHMFFHTYIHIDFFFSESLGHSFNVL
jgi:hypothetical protein